MPIVKQYNELKPVKFSTSMKSFSCEDLDPGSKGHRINDDYKLLKQNSKIMEDYVDKSVKIQFVKSHTPKMQQLDALLIKMQHVKKGVTEDADTLR